MSRGRGRRFEEPKLNMKKVFAVVLAIVVVIMFLFVVKGLLTKDKSQGKIISKDYVVAFKDNKWGVIDNEGNNIIDPSYSEMIIVPNSKNDVFLCTYDVDYTSGTYKTKALNSKNEEIFKDYEKVEAIQNMDDKSNIWYESNCLRVEKNGKYGLLNLSGKELLPCEYDEIIAIDGIKNALKIKKDDKYGVVDDEGKLVLKNEYVDITNLGEDSKEGFIIKNDEGKYGVVNYSGELVLNPEYEGVLKVHGNDLYVVTKLGKQVLVKNDGTEVLTTGFDEIVSILKNQENGIIVKNNNKFGLIKTNGDVIIQAEYDNLKEAKSGILIAKENGKYGLIDLEGNTKLEFKYNSIIYNGSANIYIAEDESFNNEILDGEYNVKLSGILIDLSEEKDYIELRVNNDYKYYNFKLEEKNVADIFTSNTLFLSKKDGKYGFLDKSGNVVVDYIYDDATEQNKYGYAGVKKDGKWGSIDNKGTLIQEPTYNLDDYLKIDFIGRWHYGKDVNMNYYNQI
ncbi:MAG: WG repeat-containing protein [Clostridia bacterium]|nr:WG repeat-containing protein [Clostridia bacterium]